MTKSTGVGVGKRMTSEQARANAKKQKPAERLPTKPPTPFTPQRKLKFIEAYRKTGLKYLAAAAAGVSVGTIDDHYKIDPVFKELSFQAKEEHTDSLVEEALRRAVEGVQEPIIGGKDRDEIVTYVQKYSDRLLELLLKSRRGEFRGLEKADAGVSGGVMLVPSRPLTGDEWQNQYGDKAKGKFQPPPVEREEPAK